MGQRYCLCLRLAFILASVPPGVFVCASLRATRSLVDPLAHVETLASGGETALPEVGSDAFAYVPWVEPEDEIHNWSEDVFARGITKHHPTTYEEVASIVREADAKGRRVRVLGQCRSWSKLLPDDDSEVIFLDHFKAITQDPHDYTLITLQGGVSVADLADFADSPDRGVGRFSYLPQSTLIQSLTFIGAAQTGSHGTGNHPPTPDAIVRATYVTAQGTIESLDRSHPDFPVLVMSLGMIGILLEVTVKFDPSTSGVTVREERSPVANLIPPPGTPINDSYNPLRDFFQGHSSSTLVYHPFNSAWHLDKAIDKDKLEEYYRHDKVWTMKVDAHPDIQVNGDREGFPFYGTQTEPFYDKDLFIPMEYFPDFPRPVRNAYKPFSKTWRATGWAAMQAAGTYMVEPPRPEFRGNVTFNTSSAASQHSFHFIHNLIPGQDFCFAYRADPDFGNIYKAWWTMLELQAELYRSHPEAVPPIFFAIVRFCKGSSSPLSAAYGDPSATYVFFEQVSNWASPAWPAYATTFLQRLYGIRSKVDNSLPKPHWAKTNYAEGLIDYIKAAMPEQLSTVREVVQRRDPKGIFRNQWLSTVFDLPHRD